MPNVFSLQNLRNWFAFFCVFLLVNFTRLLVRGGHNKEGRNGKGWKTFVVVIIGNLHWICANLFCLYNLRRFYFL